MNYAGRIANGLATRRYNGSEMLVRELASDMGWIETERAAFEAQEILERRESPLFQGAIDTAVALMGARASPLPRGSVAARPDHPESRYAGEFAR